MIQRQTIRHFSGHSDKSKGKPSRPRWHFAYLVWLICHCEGLILHNYAIVGRLMAELVRAGNTRRTPEWRERDVLPQIAVDDIRGDEYSRVTYTTQRATAAAAKHKHAVGLCDASRVSRKSLNVIMGKTCHLPHYGFARWEYNISNFTRYISTRWQLFPNNVTYTYNISWQAGSPPRARQLSFNSSSAMGSMCHPCNHESSLCTRFFFSLITE